MYNYSYLAEYIRAHSLDAELVEVPKAATSKEAAESLGISLENIAKSILFISDDGMPVLVVVRADRKVKQNALARILGFKHLRLARREEVVEITGYEPGAIPPFAHKNRISVIIDREVLNNRYVFTGGGSTRHLLKLKPKDIVAMTGGKVMDVPKRGV